MFACPIFIPLVRFISYKTILVNINYTQQFKFIYHFNDKNLNVYLKVHRIITIKVEVQVIFKKKHSYSVGIASY